MGGKRSPKEGPKAPEDGSESPKTREGPKDGSEHQCPKLQEGVVEQRSNPKTGLPGRSFESCSDPNPQRFSTGRGYRNCRAICEEDPEPEWTCEEYKAKFDKCRRGPENVIVKKVAGAPAGKQRYMTTIIGSYLSYKAMCWGPSNAIDIEEGRYVWNPDNHIHIANSDDMDFVFINEDTDPDFPKEEKKCRCKGKKEKREKKEKKCEEGEDCEGKGRGKKEKKCEEGEDCEGKGRSKRGNRGEKGGKRGG